MPFRIKQENNFVFVTTSLLFFLYPVEGILSLCLSDAPF